MMSEYAFDLYQELSDNLHNFIDDRLKNETDQTKNYVVERLNDEFRFLNHWIVPDSVRKILEGDDG